MDEDDEEMEGVEMEGMRRWMMRERERKCE